MKHKKKAPKERLTPEEKAILEAKHQEKLQLERERKEKEQYEKYVNELRENNIRAALLNDLLKSIDAMRRAHIKRKRMQLEITQWNEYVSCSSLPNIKNPPDIREFIYRWKKEIDDDIKNSCSWVLDVDEKTMLTQDMSIKNRCFWHLAREQPIIGEQYAPRINQCLALLDELENELLIACCDPALKDIKIELRTELHEALDQFTFRVLTNIERDMIRIDAYSAMLNFKSKNFSLSLWTPRPVPQISPKWREAGYTEINFSVINAALFINNRLENERCLYRGLLMNYDHFSDTASCYYLNVAFPPTPDLRTANDLEWKAREELMRGKLEQMKAERVKWEQKEQERIEKEAELKKVRVVKDAPKPVDKKQRKPKAAPPAVTEKTVIDVTEDYLKIENDLLIKQIAAMSPDSLKLAQNELNLREFQIVGGIYAFNYLERPKQYNQLKSQFLYKIGTEHILIHAGFVAISDFDLVEIQVTLDQKVNWWFAPTICRWQPWEESEEFLMLSPELQDFHKNYQKYMVRLENLFFTEPKAKLNYNVVKCLHDFQLKSLPRDVDFQQLIKWYIEPRVPITYKFQVELDAVKEILRKEALHLKEIAMEELETQQKRRSIFYNEMDEYLKVVRQDITETQNRMRAEYDQFAVQQRQHMISMGENELQIDRFLRNKKLMNEKMIREYESDEMTKYRDYVDDQYKIRVLVFEEANKTATETNREQVVKTSPRELFLPRPRQIPLKVINGDVVHNFDVPNDNDAPVFDGQIDENILLSTFLRYLLFLFEKEKPYFKEPIVEEIIIAPPEGLLSKEAEAESKRSSDSEKRPKSPNKKNTKKSAKKAKKSAKKTKKNVTAKKNPKPPVTSDDENVASSKGKKKKKGGKKSPKTKPHTAIELETKPSQPEKIEETPRVRIKKPQQNKKLHLVPHFPGKWVRSDINLLEFDIDSRQIKFKVSRFGTYGFAIPKYCNLPLTYWEVYPNLSKKHSIIMKFIGQYVEIKIEVDEDGYWIERILPNNIGFQPNKDNRIEYRELKIFLQRCGINIFPDRDAVIYVDGITEKHRSMEDHTYYCMAQFTLSHYFRYSPFNRLLDRRTGVFQIYERLDNDNIPEKFPEIMVTPQRCNTVEVSEVTTKSGETYIDCKMVPAEQDFYPDLYNLILPNCNDLSKRYHSQMKRVHRYNVARLLCSVRPLSFA